MQSLLAPPYGSRTAPNAGDVVLALAELLCATQLVVPCPALPGFIYPRPATAPTAVTDPPPWTSDPAPVANASMRQPCAGVPADPWCPASTAATSAVLARGDGSAGSAGTSTSAGVTAAPWPVPWLGSVSGLLASDRPVAVPLVW